MIDDSAYPEHVPPHAARDTASVRAHWDAKAPHWTRWADGMAAIADKFNRPLLEATGVAPGDRLLDLASGAGEPALTAAGIVGSDGHVVATDFVPGMLTGLAARAGAEALRAVAADMQALPFADGSFDRATCRFGIMFVPDPAKAMAECRRVLRPGGRAGFLVWGPHADQTLFQVLGDAVREIAGMPEDDHHWQVFRFGEAGALAALFKAAGFDAVEDVSLRFDPVAPTDKPFWRPQLEMSFGHLLAGQTKAARAALETRIREHLTPHALAEGGGYQMHVHLRLVTGLAPA